MSEISDEDWQNMSPEERNAIQIQNCIFCKIINEEIPSKKIYEDSEFVGILDINPASKGHILILPKKHTQIMPQLGNELTGKLGIVCKKLVEKLKHALDLETTTIFIANGAIAGQKSPHFMMHLIPRKTEDEINLNPELKKQDISKINILRKKFVKALGLPEVSKTKEKLEETKEKTEKQKTEEQPELQTQNYEEEQNKKELLDKISKMFD